METLRGLIAIETQPPAWTLDGGFIANNGSLLNRQDVRPSPAVFVIRRNLRVRLFLEPVQLAVSCGC